MHSPVLASHSLGLPADMPAENTLAGCLTFVCKMLESNADVYVTKKEEYLLALIIHRPPPLADDKSILPSSANRNTKSKENTLATCSTLCGETKILRPFLGSGLKKVGHRQQVAAAHLFSESKRELELYKGNFCMSAPFPVYYDKYGKITLPESLTVPSNPTTQPDSKLAPSDKPTVKNATRNDAPHLPSPHKLSSPVLFHPVPSPVVPMTPSTPLLTAGRSDAQEEPKETPPPSLGIFSRYCPCFKKPKSQALVFKTTATAQKN